MNKVIAVNLNGTAFQLEEPGYDRLRAYLDGAAGALSGNPDRDEILADIEQAIADKFRAALGAHRTVVATAEVERVITEMGPVEGSPADPAAATPSSGAAGAPPPPPPSPAGGPRRLYRIREGAMLAGVCNGMAAYIGLDVSLVRLLFVLLCLVCGAGVIAYVVLMLIVPTAETPDQKAMAQGLPKTAQEFIRRAKEGYYEGMKTWGDRRAHRAWKRKFREEMRGWRREFRHEMRSTAQGWRRQWENRAAHWGSPMPAGAALALPFLSIAEAAIGLIGLFALISLIRHRAVFGIALPTDLPLFIGILVLLALFHFLTYPVRAARWAAVGYGGPYRCGRDTLFGWILFALLLWWANHHVPAVHHLLTRLVQILQQVLDAISAWLHRHV